MKDRIKMYMEYKGISAGELALKLEVQRSNISHILNGRNKPGASFIEKMLLVYPDINARWLLTGDGEMVDTDDNLDLFSQDKPKEPSSKIAVKAETLTEPVKPAESKEKLIREEVLSSEKIIAVSDEVEKVVLLFKDGTFASFKNRN